MMTHSEFFFIAYSFLLLKRLYYILASPISYLQFIVIASALCIGRTEASTCPPPGQPPGHLTYLNIIVQIPP